MFGCGLPHRLAPAFHLSFFVLPQKDEEPFGRLRTASHGYALCLGVPRDSSVVLNRSPDASGSEWQRVAGGQTRHWQPI